MNFNHVQLLHKYNVRHTLYVHLFYGRVVYTFYNNKYLKNRK